MNSLYSLTIGRILAEKRRRTIAAAIVAPLCAALMILTALLSLLPALTGVGDKWDLNNFATGLVIRDSGNNIIGPNGTVYIGENYSIELSFAEGLDLQFEYNGSGYLLYQLPPSVHVPFAVDGDILGDLLPGETTQRAVIGEYSITAGSHPTGGLVTVKFYNCMKNGTPTPTPPGDNFINYYADANFKLYMDVKFTLVGDNMQFDFGGDAKITINVREKEPSIGVVKKQTDYNKADKTIEYTITITNNGGTVLDEIKLYDRMGGGGGAGHMPALEYLENEGFLPEVTVQVRNETPYTFTPELEYSDGHALRNIQFWYEFTGVELAPGETIKLTYKIYYDALLKAAPINLERDENDKEQVWYEPGTNGWNYNFALQNYVQVFGKDPKNNTVDDDDTYWNSYENKLLDKYGYGWNDENNTVYWQINIGNGIDKLNGVTITDILEAGQTLYTGDVFGNGYSARVWLYGQKDDACGNPNQEIKIIYFDFTSNEVANGVFSYKVPDGGIEVLQDQHPHGNCPGFHDVYKVGINFRTVIDINPFPPGGTVHNWFELDWPGNPGYKGDAGIQPPGPTNVKKDGLIYGDDEDGGHYIEWEISAVIPGFLHNKQVWFHDKVEAYGALPGGDWNREDPSILLKDLQTIQVKYYNDTTGPQGQTLALGTEYTVFGCFGSVGDPEVSPFQPLPYGFKNKSHPNYRREWRLLFGDESNYDDYGFFDYGGYYHHSLSPFDTDTKIVITFRMYIDEMYPFADVGPDNKYASYPDWTYEDLLKSNKENVLGARIQNDIYVYWSAEGSTFQRSANASVRWPVTKDPRRNPDGSMAILGDGSIEYIIHIDRKTLRNMYEKSGTHDVFLSDTFDPRFKYVENSFVLVKNSGGWSAYGPYSDGGMFKDLIYADIGDTGNSFSVNLNDMRRINTTGDGYAEIAAELFHNPDWNGNSTPGDVDLKHIEDWFFDKADHWTDYSYSLRYRIIPKDPDGEDFIDQVIAKNKITLSAENVGTFSNDCEIKYGEKVVEKTMVNKDGGNIASVEIIINPDCKQIANGVKFDVVDIMSDELAFYLDSVEVSEWVGGAWVIQPLTRVSSVDTVTSPIYHWAVTGNNEITLILPDKTHLKIEYDALIKGNDNVVAKNDVWISGRYHDQVQTMFVVTNTSGSGGGSRSYIDLYKYDGTETSVLLPGAKFALYISYPYDGHASAAPPQGVPKNFKVGTMDFYYIDWKQTGEGGYVQFDSQWLVPSFGQIYALRELEAPANYLLPSAELDRVTLFSYVPPTSGQLDQVNGKKINLAADNIAIPNAIVPAIKISKTALNPDGSPATTDNKWYEFIIKDSSGVPVDISGKSVFSSPSEGEFTTDGKDGKFKLKNNGFITISGLTDNEEYTVTETSVGNFTTTVKVNSGSPAASKEGKVTAQAGHVRTVSFTNTNKENDAGFNVRVNKLIEGIDYDDIEDKFVGLEDKTFEFEVVELTGFNPANPNTLNIKSGGFLETVILPDPEVDAFHKMHKEVEISGLAPYQRYYYMIREIPPLAADDWVYDGTVYVIEVEFERDNIGCPTTIYTIYVIRDGIVETPEGNPGTFKSFQYAFTNTYEEPKASAIIDGIKIVEGAETDKLFTFLLTEVADAYGTPIESPAVPYTDSTTTSGGGSFSFTIDDLLPGTYYYKISEQDDSASSSGWTYDDREYIVKVVVSGSPLTAKTRYPKTSAVIPGAQTSPTMNYDNVTDTLTSRTLGGPEPWNTDNILRNDAGDYNASCADRGVHNPPGGLLYGNPIQYNDNIVSLANALGNVWSSGLNTTAYRNALGITTSLTDAQRGVDLANSLVQVYLWRNHDFPLPLYPAMDPKDPDSWPVGTSITNKSGVATNYFNQIKTNQLNTADKLAAYIQEAHMLEAMMAQYDQGKQTSLVMTYLPNDATSGTLFFVHDGFVPHKWNSTLDSDKTYSTRLTWTGNATVTVNNGSPVNNGTTGVIVREKDVIAVTGMSGSPVFTLTDSTHYLVPGSIEGALYEYIASPAAYQRLHVSCVKFTTLKCTLTPGDGGIVFTNIYGEEGGPMLPDVGGIGTRPFVRAAAALGTTLSVFYIGTLIYKTYWRRRWFAKIG